MTTRPVVRRMAVLVSSGLLAVVGLSGCGGDSAEDFCSVGGDLDQVDPAAADFDEDDFQNALDDAVDAAPDEIKDDVETLRDALGGIDFTDPEALANDPEAVAALTSPEVTEASQNVSDYVAENCDTAN